MEVKVAKTAGFCFGVKRAVEKAYEVAAQRQEEVYTYGPIIHNEEVVSDLEERGVHVLETEEYREAETLFVYVDCKHETETSDLIRRAWADGKSVAVPRVLGQEMKFFYIHSLETDLEDGYFGIREPYEKEPADEAADRPGSLMVMPGVAFDEARHRIGYGGGFYDRYLEAHPGLDTIALAFEFQVKEEVPFEPFDILPGKIVTEKRVIS